MTTVREVMHPGVECANDHDTLELTAQRMRDLHIGALPILGPGGELHGIVTDRDIIVRCVAEGRDPRKVTAGELARGSVVSVDADAGIDEALHLMEEHKIRRLPVIRANDVVGIMSEADLAVHLGEHPVALFAEAVYSAPPNS